MLSSCGGDDGPSSYALNVYVSGLTGSGLQVALNGGAPIPISANSQTTVAHLKNGTAYTIAVTAQPITPTQTCSAVNQSGKIAGNNVDVMINCVAAPTVALSAGQSTINAGSTVLLTWSTTNATACSASGGWSGSEPISGSLTSAPLGQNTQFTLTCSGPDGSVSASQTVAVTQAGASVISTATITLAAGSTLVTDGDTTVDFSSDSSLLGHTASVQHISASLVNDTAAETKASIGTDFSNTGTVRISVTAAPASDTVHVTINTGSLPTIQAGIFPAIYVWSDSDPTDGAPDFVPVATTYNPAASTVEADIPRYEFRQDSILSDSSLSYVTIMRIGLAQTATTQGPSPASLKRQFRGTLELRPQATTGSTASITCPLASFGCLEKSMFNPSRKLSNSASKHHNGIDLSATTGTSLYSIPGGKIVAISRSLAWFSDPTNHASLSAASVAAGVEVQVQAQLNGAGILLKYFHLQDVATYLKNTADPTGSNGGLLPGSVVESDGLIGATGQTGAAESGGAHLHFEMWVFNMPACTVQGTTTSCAYVQSPVDTFPYMVKTFSITPPQAPAQTLANSPFTFPVTASDAGSPPNIISSNVGNASEITQYGGSGDPTRKVCFADSALELTYTFSPTNPPNTGPVGPPLLPSGNYQCAPWGTSFGATANPSAGSVTTVSAWFTVDPLSPIMIAQLMSPIIGSVTIGGMQGGSGTFLFTVTSTLVCSGSGCGFVGPSTSTYSDTITLTKTAPNSNQYYCTGCQENLPNFALQYPYAQYTTFSLPISVNYSYCAQSGPGSTDCGAYDDHWQYTVDLTGVRGSESLNSSTSDSSVSGTGVITSIPQAGATFP